MDETAPAPAQPTFFRSAGVLLHPTSLPSRHGIGDLGAGARTFVDWLADARLARWQVLPLGPPGPFGTPYSSPSAFAMNPLLLDLDALHHDGLLDAADVAVDDPFPFDHVDFERVVPFKQARIDKAAARLLQSSSGRAIVDGFREREPWVGDYALFAALKARQPAQSWQSWDPDLKRRAPAALAAARDALHDVVDVHIATQALVDQQWRALRAYAAGRGTSIIGDLPIYVDLDSVDVWANATQFLLDADGRPLGVAGVPPDAFSETGQLWGNPLYDWKRMKPEGYAWWKTRLQRAFSLFDVVRIDHFRAFASYWAVPTDAVDARGGTWVRGPGIGFFDELRAAFPALPVILEDLGIITDDVRALRDATGLPGMAVLQFAFGQGPDAAYLPHNHAHNAVVYTGTHDNDTTAGFWLSANPALKDHLRRYLGVDGHDFVWDFIRTAFQSVAHTAIVPMQDVLGLDGRSRMNTPGFTHDNWGWRARRESFYPGAAARLRALAELYGRALR